MLLVKQNRDKILGPLQAVCGVVEKRHTLPILSNVLVEREGDRLTFLATDIEIQIRASSVGLDEGENGAVTVGARKLQDILRALPDSSEISFVLEDKRMLVKAGKSRFSLQTLPAADFPQMAPPAEAATRLSLSQKELRRLLGLVQYAMAQQDIRYYLNGLLLVVDGDKLRAVATDGHRLAYASMDISESLPRQELILPRKTVLELSRQLSDNDDAVDVLLSPTLVRFSFANTELVSKLIDGKFPDYERVIPTSHTKEISLSRAVMLQSLQRAAILTNEKFRGVRIVLTQGSMKLVAANADQEEAQEEIEIDYNGEALDIGFNVTYLLDALNNASTDTVEWKFGDANSSALMTLPGNDSFKYVVMPMRI